MLKRTLVLWAGLLALLMLAGFAQAAKPVATTLPANEWKAIRGVISNQLKAFKEDDGEVAFSHAAPPLRKLFGTPSAFLAMVKSTYYPVLSVPWQADTIAAGENNGAVHVFRVIEPDDPI